MDKDRFSIIFDHSRSSLYGELGRSFFVERGDSGDDVLARDKSSRTLV